MFAYTPIIAARLFPHAKAAVRDGVVKSSFGTFSKYGIVELQDLIDFTAEISEETGGLIALEENLNYSAQRLMQVWPTRFPSLGTAQLYAGSPEKLADRVYGGRMGNTEAGDGYMFRGRGAIQLTGRTWYDRVGNETGLDLLNHPELVLAPENLLPCAAAFWKLDGVSALAVAGDFNGEVKRINGGYTNMATRLALRDVVTNVLTPDVVSFDQDPNATQTAPAPAAVQAQIVAVTHSINAIPPHKPLLDELIALWRKYL